MLKCTSLPAKRRCPLPAETRHPGGATVSVPEHPPEIMPEVARILLKALLEAQERQQDDQAPLLTSSPLRSQNQGKKADILVIPGT